MSEFVTVARVGDIPAGTSQAFPVGDKLVAVFHLGDDHYAAINDLCPHMGASLAAGHLEAGVVVCPWHAWRFRVCDGVWLDNPRIKTDCYMVRVVDGDIQVALTPPADAPPSN